MSLDEVEALWRSSRELSCLCWGNDSCCPVCKMLEPFNCINDPAYKHKLATIAQLAQINWNNKAWLNSIHVSYMYDINNFITKNLKRTKKWHLTHNPKIRQFGDVNISKISSMILHLISLGKKFFWCKKSKGIALFWKIASVTIKMWTDQLCDSICCS